MRNPKVFFIWIYKQVSNYNLFILDQHDYENDDTIRDPVIILRKQKYKTRLYIVLLAVCLYILFYGICIKMESETIVIFNVTPDNFDQLYNEYDQTLSCPCSTIAISYKNFVSNNIIMHPVCSSYFVDKKWIEGLYFVNASRYNIQDFRKVAYSQFELLSRFCSLSQNSRAIVTHDLNSDNYLDLILGLPSSNEIYGLLGDGNGNFQTQIIYSSIINNYTDDVDISNNKICQNIINMNLMNNSLYILYNPCRCSTHQTS
ncbi:unnamed protein product [Adineta ricciae]|uniref:Transmembrane protein n=1 Tax=Adineta ricciae TaxID=249248 RepID=A0A813N5V0_ADIRI|nr:unnamed protein product [Adineta ricciae]